MQNCSLQQDLRLELSEVLRELPQDTRVLQTCHLDEPAWRTWQGNYILGQGGDVICGDFPFKNLQQKPA